jgi:hypothetical protein
MSDPTVNTPGTSVSEAAGATVAVAALEVAVAPVGSPPLHAATATRNTKTVGRIRVSRIDTERTRGHPVGWRVPDRGDDDFSTIAP